MKIKRTNVYVSINHQGSVFEATNNPDIMIVYLQQDEIHTSEETQKSTKEVRRCKIETDVQLYKEGFRLPGMIIKEINTKPINDDDWVQGIIKDSNGNMTLTEDENPLYEHYWYNHKARFQPNGISKYDDRVEQIN